VRAALGLPAEPEAFLLVAEGRVQEAVRLLTDRLRPDHNRPLDPCGIIECLIALSLAHSALFDAPAAREALDRAATLMRQTGCYRDRNRFADAEQALAAIETA